MFFLTYVGCLFAAIATWLICANAGAIARFTGLVDAPDGKRKLHKGDVPLIGGLAVVLPAIVLAFLYIAWFQPQKTLGLAVASMAAAALIGVCDDRVGLAASKRFLALAAIVGLACFFEPAFVLHNLRLNFLDFETSFGPFAAIITIFIVLGFVNAANLADGINGQFLGSILIWCGFILVYAPSERTPFLVLLTSTLVALIFNLRGKLFSGSTGSYTLSLFVGLSTIALYRRSNGVFHGEIPVYWFWLPVLDCLRLFAWRIFKNRSPFSADRCHIHHVLARLGGDKHAVLIYLAMLATPGVVAIYDEKAGFGALLLCCTAYTVTLGLEKLRRSYRVLILGKTENA